MKVNVLDVIMGYGKSEYAISYINNNPNNYYFVVLPYLDEVERYIENTTVSLTEPIADDGFSKSDSLLELIKIDKKNVVTTHAMFEELKSDHLESLKKMPLRRGEKVLVLDEQIDLVKPVNSSKLPLKSLEADIDNDYIVVNESSGVVKWNHGKEPEYQHHNYLKGLCDTGMLYFLDRRYLVVEVPLDFLQCFDSVLIMTYRWQHSIMANYLEVNDVKTVRVPVDEERALEVYKYVVEHLIIPENVEYIVGDLSKNAMKSEDINLFKKSFNRIIKQAMNDYNVPMDKVLFTTFRTIGNHDMVEWLKTIKLGKWQRLDRGGRIEPAIFLSHTTLGTNEFADREIMVYGIDKHLQPGVHAYFSQRKHSMDGEGWALSSMLQWLFRGCIRDRTSGKKMVAVIMCPRMRDMAIQWLAGLQRQVGQWKLDEKEELLTMPAKERRTKKQAHKRWLKAFPEGKCFSFEDYVREGGPALKRKWKRMQK